MHNRRKFIVQTSLATAAIAFLKPLQSVAPAPVNVSLSSEKISILDIGSLGYDNINFSFLHKMQSGLQKENCHSLLVSTGNIINANQASREYHIQQLNALQKIGLQAVLPGSSDVAKGEEYYNELIRECNLLSLNNNESVNSHLLPYHTMQKGNIRVGIIGNIEFTKPATGSNKLKRTSLLVNETAKYLKETGNCNLIVLMQSFKSGSDQINKEYIELAGLTQNVHLIVSPYKAAKNCTTVIAKNIDAHEVVISFAAIENTAPQRIEIAFNEKMERNSLAIHSVA